MLLKKYSSCIATGETETELLRAAHIAPLEKSELFKREDYYSEKNGVILRNDLEDDYDRHMWIFDPSGKVTVLFQRWIHRNTIASVNLLSNGTGPANDLIALHNNLAFEAVKHHCPHCWKYVGEVNRDDHERGSCEAIDNIGEDDDLLE